MDDYIVNNLSSALPNSSSSSLNNKLEVVSFAPDLTPTSSKLLESGAQRISAIFSAVQRGNLSDAVKLIAGSLSGSEGRQRSKTCADEEMSIKRGSYENVFNLKEAEEMRRCWNYEESVETVNIQTKEEERKADTVDEPVACLMEQIDNFVTTFEREKPRRDIVRARAKTSVIELVAPSSIFSIAQSLIGRKSKREQLIEKAKLLKEELLSFMDECNKEALDCPLELPPEVITFVPPAPPPPPPPIFTVPEPIQRQTTPQTPRKQSVDDRVLGNIKSAILDKFNQDGKPNLRRTCDVQRSPGGTPIRSRSPTRGSVEHELFAGLRKRFQTMQESETDEDDYDKPPLAPKSKVRQLASKLIARK